MVGGAAAFAIKWKIQLPRIIEDAPCPVVHNSTEMKNEVPDKSLSPHVPSWLWPMCPSHATLACYNPCTPT